MDRDRVDVDAIGHRDWTQQNVISSYASHAFYSPPIVASTVYVHGRSFIMPTICLN